MQALSVLLLSVDWGNVFLPDASPLEIFIRGSFTYLVIFTLLKLVLKRESGGFNLPDLLVVVLIADAAQNSMAGEYRSIADGILLVATIVGWSFILDWLGYHVPVMGRFLHPEPLPLVIDGHELRRNMRKELITHDELMSFIRQAGGEDIADV